MVPSSTSVSSAAQRRSSADRVVYDPVDASGQDGERLYQKRQAAQVVSNSWVVGETVSSPSANSAAMDNGCDSPEKGEPGNRRDEQTPSALRSADVLYSDSSNRSVHADTEIIRLCREGGLSRASLPASGAQGATRDALSARESEKTVPYADGVSSEGRAESLLAGGSLSRAGASDVVSDVKYMPTAIEGRATEAKCKARPLRRSVPILEGDTRGCRLVGMAAAARARRIESGSPRLTNPFMACCGGEQRPSRVVAPGDKSSEYGHCFTDMQSDNVEVLVSERGGRGRSTSPPRQVSSRGHVLVAARAEASGEVEKDFAGTGLRHAAPPSAPQPQLDSHFAVSISTHLPNHGASERNAAPAPLLLKSPEPCASSQMAARRVRTPVVAPESQTSASRRQRDRGFTGCLNFLAWCAQPCGVTSGPGGNEFVLGPPRLHRRRQLPVHVDAGDSDDGEPFAAVFVVNHTETRPLSVDHTAPPAGKEEKPGECLDRDE